MMNAHNEAEEDSDDEKCVFCVTTECCFIHCCEWDNCGCGDCQKCGGDKPLSHRIDFSRCKHEDFEKDLVEDEFAEQFDDKKRIRRVSSHKINRPKTRGMPLSEVPYAQFGLGAVVPEEGQEDEGWSPEPPILHIENPSAKLGDPDPIERKRMIAAQSRKRRGSVSDHPELECPLCLDLFYEPIRLQCLHIFCKDCVMKTMSQSRKCPLCRKIIMGLPTLVKTVDTEIATLCKSRFPEQYELRGLRLRAVAQRVKVEGGDDEEED